MLNISFGCIPNFFLLNAGTLRFGYVIILTIGSLLVSLAAGQTVPDAASSVVVDGHGDQSIDISWTAPVSDGGAAITGYKVEYSTDNGGAWTVAQPDTGSATTSATVTGLVNGTSYVFRVSAINSNGTGAASAASSAEYPSTVPDAASSVVVDGHGDQSIDISWTAPASDGGAAITGYKVEYSTDNGGAWTVAQPDTGSATTSATVTGLVNGTSYVFRVSAINRDGTGATSAASSAEYPSTVPDAASSVVVDGHGDQSIDISWTAPVSDGGAAITGYKVEYSTDNGGAWTVAQPDTGSATTSATVTGLVNGTSYVFRVSAINRDGTGATSAASSAEYPSKAPDAPSGIAAVAQDRSLDISWTAPSDQGGDNVSGYTIERSSDQGATWVTATTNTGQATPSYTDVNLVNGTPYRYRIRAINRDGAGIVSQQSSDTVPRTVPDAPTTPLAAPADVREILLSWEAPADNGGDAVSGYLIEVSNDSGHAWSTLVADTQAAETEYMVSGLSIGTAYRFRLKAINAAGASLNYSPSTNDVPFRELPGAPTGASAIHGDSRVSLSWFAPVEKGGEALTGYRIEVATAGGPFTVAVDDTQSTATSHVFLGLNNGTEYRYRVSARNSAGPGPASDTVVVTPATFPNPPGSVTVVPGDSSIAVSWTAPAFDGGSSVQGYAVAFSVDGQETVVSEDTGNTDTSFQVPDLDNGVSYVVLVAAINAEGYSVPKNSAVSVPRTVPGVPQDVAATPLDGAIELHWNPPSSDGGAPVTGYIAQLRPSEGDAVEHEIAAGLSSHVVADLGNGIEYDVSLRAANIAGRSTVVSVADPVVPYSVPSAPRNVAVSESEAKTVTISWQAPVSDGGRPITHYEVEKSADGTTWALLGTLADPNATEIVSNDVRLGQDYVFRVRAVNARGRSDPSEQTAQLTLRTWAWYSYVFAGVAAGVVLTVIASRLFGKDHRRRAVAGVV